MENMDLFAKWKKKNCLTVPEEYIDLSDNSCREKQKESVEKTKNQKKKNPRQLKMTESPAESHQRWLPETRDHAGSHPVMRLSHLFCSHVGCSSQITAWTHCGHPALLQLRGEQPLCVQYWSAQCETHLVALSIQWTLHFIQVSFCCTTLLHTQAMHCNCSALEDEIQPTWSTKKHCCCCENWKKKINKKVYGIMRFW